jgi:hypothetical protein
MTVNSVSFCSGQFIEVEVLSILEHTVAKSHFRGVKHGKAN